MTDLKIGDPLVTSQSTTRIRTQSCETCYLCGQIGQVIHQDLCDRLYDVAGKWSLRKCLSPDCGLVWLDPVPVKEDLGNAYEGYFTHMPNGYSLAYRARQRIKRGFAGLAYGYSSKVLLIDRILTVPIYLFPFLKEQIVATGFMYLRGERLGKVLEIGCGDGSLLNNLRNLGWEVEGVDFDPGAVRTAIEHHQLNVRLGSVEEQGYLDSSFDAIVMSHVIEHIPDPVRLLAECARLLKPGGTVVISTPNLNSMGYQHFKSSWLSLDPPRHLYLFNSQTLTNTVQKGGLEVTSTRTTTRGTLEIWLASKAIAGGGKGLAQGSFFQKIKAKAFQMKEAAMLLQSIDAGEELLLMAEKRP